MTRSDIWGWTFKAFGITVEVVFVRRSLVTIAIDHKGKTWRVLDR
jgi:hypothetical protein